MMDSYNLAWKLIHSINGLTPQTGPGDEVLDTYQTERLTVAKQLIAFDKEFSSMFSGKIGSDMEGGLTHEQFLEVFSTGNGFTSGCGIEYPENLLVDKTYPEGLIGGTDYLSGVLRPGRRLLNVKVKRHADGYRRDLQDGKFSKLIHSANGLINLYRRFPFNGTFPRSLPYIYGSSNPDRHFLNSPKRTFSHTLTFP